jgi:carbon-monoxide dehydrogenase medium subunit
LAGGQSLMPMMNFRYVMPDNLIDINRVAGLDFIRIGGKSIELGAMTRHRALEFSSEIRALCPVLAEAIPHIGHRQTRNRGTIGGSLAHADPSAELPSIAMALDAILHVEGARGRRDIPVAQFATGYMSTDLAADELLHSVTLPVWPRGHGYAFLEFARRRGDFAIVSAAVLLLLDRRGAVSRASLTISGIGPNPERMTEGEAMLRGHKIDAGIVKDVAMLAGKLDAASDIHAGADYRRHLAQVLLGRAIATAAARAGAKHG